MKIPYSKPPESPAKLVSLLHTRGLLIADFSKAEEYITKKELPVRTVQAGVQVTAQACVKFS